MKNSTLFAIVVFLLVMAAFPSMGRADAVLSVSSPASVSVGDSFTVDVLVSQAVDLYGFQFDLSFDPGVLQGTGFTEGTFLSSVGSTFFFNSGIDNTAGTSAFNVDSLLGVPSGANGAGTLVTFDFLAFGAGTSPLTISNAVLSDSNGDSSPFSIQNGSVTVTTTGPIPTPEPSSLILVVSAVSSLAFLGLIKKRPSKDN